MTRLTKYLFGALLLLLGVVACDPIDSTPVVRVDSSQLASKEELEATQPQDENIYLFGFDLRSSPQEDAAQYLPFLRYLEQQTGYRFKLHFTPKHMTTAKELGLGVIQFAAMGASSFIQAQTYYGAKILARGVNQQNRAEYQSMFVVRPDSPIRNYSDFKSRRLAFGSHDSTQGFLIPSIMLYENGISLDQLAAYGFTGSHQNCAEAVIAGDYDICGMQDQLARKLAASGLLSIIQTSRYYPSSGIAASREVDEEVAQKVRQALLDFRPLGEHRAQLYHWERTEMPLGFTAARAQDYTDLKRWMIKFGLLKTPDGAASP